MTVLCAAAAGEDCLWYVDRNGSWHPGFECQLLSFCCGSCHQRFCCRDPLRLITERQQRHCLAFRCRPASGTGAGLQQWVLAFSNGCWVLAFEFQDLVHWMLDAGHWAVVLGAGH